MTITSEATKVEVVSATADTYTFNLAIHKATDLEVYIDGALTATNDGTNPYSVTVAANKQSASIAFTNTGVSAPHRLKPLIFSRVVEFKQETDLANNSLFDAESLETTLDNIVMQTMQVGNVVLSASGSTSFSFDGALGTGVTMFNSTPTAASTLTKNKAARIGKALAFDANGDITISETDIDNAIDYQLEAEQWARKASGNVNTFLNGVEQADGSAISAKAQATAAAASAGTASTALTSFQSVYRGASGSAPGSPVDGQLWYDSTNDLMKVYNGTSTAWEQLTPTASNQTNINAAVADQADIGRVAAIDTEIGRLGTSDMSVGSSSYLALLGHSSMSHASTGYLKLLGDIDDKIIALGASAVIGYITALNGTNVITHMAALNASGVITNIAALNASGVISDIGDVAGKTTEIGRLGSADTQVDLAKLGTDAVVADLAILGHDAVVLDLALLGDQDIIDDMALIGASGVIGDIQTVADGLDNVDTFANRYRVASTAPQSSLDQGDLYFNTSNNTLFTYGTAWKTASPSAADQTNIDIVAGELTYEEDLGLITDAATTSSGNDISDVAALDTEIGLLAAKATEMGRLGTAAIAGASTGALARLGTAAVVEDVGHLGTAANVLAMAEIGTSANVTSMAALAASGVVANIATVATYIANVNRYANEYIIASSAPGSPSEGDLWYDSTNNLLKFHNGTSFVSISAEIHNEMVQDTTPTLGGDLDADSNDITNMGNIDGTNLNIDFGSI